MAVTMRPVLTHAGILVRDLQRMRAFYAAILGLVESDSGHTDRLGLDLVFMTADPSKHHQIVMAAGRGAQERSTVFQLAFKVEKLAELREFERRARAAGAPHLTAQSHGNAWSVYFDDPEGNTIEIYMDTPWYVPQPEGEPLDLSLPDAEILRREEERCRTLPGFKLVAEWQAGMKERLRESSAR